VPTLQHNMERLFRCTLLLLGLAAESGAAPTDNSGALAITGSSDAWASLVANVVPLLILIGEKNVKSYFKTISQPSQVYLYAASPIGLITAIVTAIRLGNSAFMKRLIGRQHEGRSEVLADVTSISGGNVGFELKGPRSMLEQTIDPKPKDEAHFWIHGRVMGTGREGLRFRDDVEAVVRNASTTGYRALGKPSALEAPLHEPLYTTRFLKHIASRLCGSRVSFASSTSNVGIQRRDNVEGDKTNLGREPWWLADEIPNAARICEATVVTVFEAAGPNATETTRLYAAQWARCGKFKDLPLNHDQTKHSDSGRCSSRSLACINWPDVSHTLTTTANVQVPLIYFSSLLVIGLCLSANAVLVVLNWRAQRDVMTTTFVSLGLLGSYSFSVWTAMLVGQSTRQATIPVKDIQPFRAGFMSTNLPFGVRMAYSPKRVVMSMERNMRRDDYEEGPSWHIPLFVIMSTSSFLTLYLGLRAAEWWLPFAMFGNVGFATCMRAILTINSPLYGRDWHKYTGPSWHSNSLYGPDRLWLLHLSEDLQMTEECRSSLTQHRRGTQRKATAEDHRTGKRQAPSPVPNWLCSQLNTKRKVTWDKLQSDKHNDLLSQQKLANPEVTEPLLERWTVVASSQHVTGLDVNGLRMLLRDAGSSELRLVEASYAVASMIAQCHLLPHDFNCSNYSPDGYGRQGPERARLQLLRSEFISQNGIWQQPLEIAVLDVEKKQPPHTLVVTLLRTWAVQAFFGGQMTSKSRAFSRTAESERCARAVYSLLLHLPDGVRSADTVTVGSLWQLQREALDEGFPGMCRSKSCQGPPSVHTRDDWDGCPGKLHEFPVGNLDSVTASRLCDDMWSYPWMLWMGVKIVLALSSLDSLRRLAPNYSDAENPAEKPMKPVSKWHGLTWARDYVNFLNAAGLLKPSPEGPVTTQNEELETVMLSEDRPTGPPDMSSSAHRRLSVSPGLTSSTIRSGVGIRSSDNVGYTSFG